MTTVTGTEAPTPTPRGRRVSPRLAVLVVSGMSSLVLAVVIAVLPVPYVIFAPGPVRDTLGTLPNGDELVRIDGAPTYPTSGELALTTISVTGGPLGDLSVVDVVGAWLDPTRSVRPVETVYPAQRTREEAEQEGQAEMRGAQQAAAVAALTAADIDVPVRLEVLDVVDGVPADGVVAEGDVVTAFQGTPVAGSGELVDLVQRQEPGDTVAITVERDGEERELDVELGEDGGSTVIGVLLEPRYELPFPVRYDVSGIGGPSAGLMFALGIYDKITEGELTGGESIAGTGTITEDGVVGPIDGIQQKMVGARDTGAEWFLAPEENCGDVRGAVPDGITVVRVADMTQALTAVTAIAAGEAAGLPSC
jgi:PDZ domain-containing protein